MAAAAASPKFTLVNNPVCPFGARAHIAAAEHVAPEEFEYKIASLSDKPEWFTEVYRSAIGADVSSTGKVPVLADGSGLTICESAIVAEYLDRKYAASPDARLLSDDPAERAAAQLFVESFSGRIVGGFYKLLMAPKGEKRDELFAAYTKTMEDFDAALRANDARTGGSGPFFAGDRFGWVEVMLYPWFGRRAALRVHRGWELPTGEGFERLNAWVAACAARPSVVNNASPDEYYAEQYATYAAKGDA